MPHLDFWYEFASPYSWLAAMRIEGLAAAAGVEVAWRPFLLGPIFKAQGWTTSPFNLYPAKGRHMLRDLARLAQARGLPFRMPETFPANGLLAARLALVAASHGRIAAFTRAVFTAEFAEGRDIADRELLADLLARLGLDAAGCLDAADAPAIRDTLRDNTATAVALGIFGAPSFVCSDGELFWGNDRLEAALTWAATT